VCVFVEACLVYVCVDAPAFETNLYSPAEVLIEGRCVGSSSKVNVEYL